MGDERAGLKFVCLRYGSVLRLHLYTGGGTLMSSLQSADARGLKDVTVAWLASRRLAFDERELDAAIGRAEEAPA
jgi:hypothetical protein